MTEPPLQGEGPPGHGLGPATCPRRALVPWEAGRSSQSCELYSKASQKRRCPPLLPASICSASRDCLWAGSGSGSSSENVMVGQGVTWPNPQLHRQETICRQ